MKKLYCSLIILLTVPILSGCSMTLVGYVDPALPKVRVNELKVPASPKPIRVDLEFQRDGVAYEPAKESVMDGIIMAMEKTNMFSSIKRGPLGTERTLKMVINNTGGGKTSGSGYVTGLTGGALGSAATDRYIIKGELLKGGQVLSEKQYQHALHSTLGNKKGPAGLTPMPIAGAIDKVMEEAVFLMLKEMQDEGVL